jgi:hypothetical protein
MVGGTRQRHLDGTNFKPHKLPDCPQGVRTAKRPTTMVSVLFRGSDALHLPWGSARVIPVLFRDAVLGNLYTHRNPGFQNETKPNRQGFSSTLFSAIHIIIIRDTMTLEPCDGDFFVSLIPILEPIILNAILVNCFFEPVKCSGASNLPK